MDTRNQKQQPKTSSTVSQMQVRSGVRSGGDMETCEWNLNKWKERYYYWYDQAHKQGKI